MKTLASLRLINIFFIALVLNDNGLYAAIPGRNSISLYNANDKLNILTSQNLSSNVYQSKTAWLVEFYASWCGHCQAYTKTFREIGIDTWAWQTVVRIGVINCYAEENVDICNRHNIQAYPTLRFIEPQTTENISKVVGINPTGANVVERDLINQLSSLKRTEDYWPKFGLIPLNNFEELFTQILPSVKVIFIIVEEQNDFTGRQIMLDFSKYYQQIAIVRTSRNATFWQQQNIKITHTPSLFAISLNRTIDSILISKANGSLGNRNLLHQLIRSYINERNIVENFDEREFQDIDIRRNFIKNGEKNDRLSSFNPEKKDEENKKKQNQKVNMLDLETGLSYMLRREVPRMKEIQGETYYALIDWLTVLNKYFPGREPIMTYLKRLLTKVKEQQNGITGHQFRALADTNTATAYLPDNTVEYQYCAGSSLKYRGYPCSLWTLFHTLTVSQAKAESDISNILEILTAIRGFIKHFFGCRHCSENFMNETREMDRLESKTKYEAMIYLWKVHNSVNKRLAKDITEDPEHPKVQFPPADLCPKCRVNKDGENNEFDTANIIDFLLTYYAKENIDQSFVYNFKVEDNEGDTDERRNHHEIIRDRKMVELHELDSRSFFDFIPSIFRHFPFYFIVGILIVTIITRRRYCRSKPKRHIV